MVKIYTKQGDEGETGLLYGGRISKASLQTESYGTNDEAISALGLARALSKESRVQDIIKELQRNLFTVGAELATAPNEYDKLKAHFSVITPQMVHTLEHHIDDLDAQIDLPRAFIIPGASPASAAMDMARTILRRGERRAVEMSQQGLVPNPEILRFLNRAADLIFMLGRYEDRNFPFEALTGE